MKKPKQKILRSCYFCERRRRDHKRITLAGPARRRVYACRDETKCQ